MKRDEFGQFLVIPLSVSPNTLGDSKEYALGKFLSLEKKLQKNSQLRKAYVNFMTEYQVLGLYWSFKLDELMYHVDICSEVGKVTKRSILSEVSRLFDPFGLIIAKILKKQK
ncbi:hypothetical protein NQ317_002751 [Molorchus minor]|uniref:Uncharacterized protein n=1 Tax=Molorchus minor TaxID=1323400 RepID=A0ABQ9J196_9CUCU|nr:hypothetical protein NQ317_002751 [Molorchus minor]